MILPNAVYCSICVSILGGWGAFFIRKWNKDCLYPYGYLVGIIVGTSLGSLL